MNRRASNSDRPMRILHLAPTLEVGGAERFIQRLAPVMAARHGVEQRVIGLTGDGQTGAALREAGIAAEAVSQGGVIGLIRSLRAVRSIVATWQPDVVQTWLYIADLAGALATAGHARPRLVWNLRCSDAWLNARTRTIRRACIAMSRHAPDAIVACGERAAAFHEALGYPASKTTVIPNGYRFPPLEEMRAERERRHAIRTGKGFVIGAVGRYDRAKGYSYLLDAIARLRADGRNVTLALAGRGCDRTNEALASEIDRRGLADAVNLHGEIDDLFPFYANLDLFCLSSVSEGFPNALCEAIASGVPAVATRVGDSPQIMGPDGTVPPRSAEALTQRMAELLDTSREIREMAAATSAIRVRSTYDLDQIADRYHALYLSLLGNSHVAQS